MKSPLVLISIIILNSIAFSQTNLTQIDPNNLTPSQIAMAQQFFEESQKKNNRQKPIVKKKEVPPKQKADPNISVKKESLSTLEEAYNNIDILHLVKTKIGKNKTVTDNKKLKQFGYSFFNKKTFNNNDLIIPENYLLQKGDSFTLFIYGKKEMILVLSVDNEGEVFIPDIGPVLVAGLSIVEANKKISTKLKRKFVNFESKLKINYLKDVTVLISGNVNNPGAYSINKYESIFSVLSRSNGVSKTGSLRNIKLLKSSGQKLTIDLYNYLLIDSKQIPITFNEGDVLFVPGLTDSVAITGAVNNPGIYEILNNETINDVIQFASGTALNAYPNSMYINRFDNTFKRKVISISTNSIKDMKKKRLAKVYSGDVIVIPKKSNESYGYVNIMGNVNIPGKFEYKSNMTLGQLILKAQGIKKDTYPDVHIFRYLSDENRKLIRVKLDSKNTKIMDRDIVTIYNKNNLETPQFVTIIGEVMDPGEYHYFQEMTLNDLIILAKLKQFTSLSLVEVARFNGKESELLYVSQSNLGEFTLQPGDRVSLKKDNLRDQTATIELKGEFVYPGLYKVTKGTKLSEVIKKAGGYTDSAYLKGTVFLRKSVLSEDKIGQQKVIDDEKRRFIYDQSHLGNLSVDSKVSMGIMMTARQEALKFLENKSRASSGRVIIDLHKSNFQQSKDNFIIQDGDILDVPIKPESIHIIGGVQQGISMAYNPSYSLYSYIENVGGFTKYADRGNIYVFKTTGRVFKNHNNIEPGDIIYVPEKVIISFNWLQFLTSITQIVSNAVTSIALIRSIQ